MHEISSQLVPLADYKKVRRVDGFERISSEYPIYLTDESKLSPEPFDHLFFPADEPELAAILQEMAAQEINVTIAGARTGLVGGCVPRRGVLVSLENFDRIQAIMYDAAADEWRVRSQCAVNLRSLGAQLSLKNFPDIERCGDQAALTGLQDFKQDPAAYFYPPDPTEMSASLGGTVATNASGARTYRYGPTRSWVREIRVMLISGEVLRIPRGKYFASHGGVFAIYDSKNRETRIKLPSYPMPLTKNTSGFFSSPQMDLIDLFIGSEGCFGVITEVTVALLRKRDTISLVQFLANDEQAIDLVHALREEKQIRLNFLEFYSGQALTLMRRMQLQDPKAVDMPLVRESARDAPQPAMVFSSAV